MPDESAQPIAPIHERDKCHPVERNFIPEGREPPHEILVELVKAWFKTYHPWHPLLHQPSLEEYIQFEGGFGDDPKALILMAIAAVIIPSWYPDVNLSQLERIAWSQSLRSQVLFRSISELSFHGLQAMLILTTLDYGNGNLSNFWNLIGICQRSVSSSHIACFDSALIHEVDSACS